jgi:hypothetical protein
MLSETERDPLEGPADDAAAARLLKAAEHRPPFGSAARGEMRVGNKVAVTLLRSQREIAVAAEVQRACFGDYLLATLCKWAISCSMAGPRSS